MKYGVSYTEALGRRFIVPAHLVKTAQLLLSVEG